ncbi:DEAD/DEAH box helicase [Corallococcus sp. AB050B]|nr:DEAD/DEAH box helicase [Corallococcus sp. AB050B]
MEGSLVDSFEQLRRYLIGETTASPRDFTEACQRRLVLAVGALCEAKLQREALRTSSRPERQRPMGVPGSADLAVLVRHVLRREQELQGGSPQSLLVPVEEPWPLREQWALFGLEVSEARSGFLRVQAMEWRPDWLAQPEPPEKAVFAEDVRRSYEAVPGDPVLAVARPSPYSYRSVAQREALRTVLASPEGSTLTVSLPTGAGKSLLAQVPALWLSRTSGIAVVVVPTTALCIDQERALGHLVDHPTAYFSGTDVEARERNQGIRQRIRQGTQRIVFTSPESLLGPLSGALYDAARVGFLRLLVVDEAHMIEQWGDGFRSAFQEVAGIRRGLLRACPEGKSFRTLLLTATLTEPCLDMLEALFKEPGDFGVTASVQLRPEPSFHFARCGSPEEKKERLLQALRHLPRPLILYTTKVADAQEWTRLLRLDGFHRCEEVTGQTGHSERRRILRQWQDAETDVVVATSAFGLGVDKKDVRAVLHACVPENVDRYYQEVGRGGRDGRASLSLVVYTSQDVHLARRMSRRKLIGIGRGQERWKSMFEAAEPLGPGRYRIPLDVSPGVEVDDIDMAERSYNLEWNIRTLTLMARAGLLSLASEAPPRLSSEEEARIDLEAWYAQAFDRYSRQRVVEILDEEHMRSEAWIRAVESVRQCAISFAWRGHELMRECLEGSRCIAEILAEVYRIPPRSSRLGIDVALACGGCAACWKNGLRRSTAPAPAPRSAWPRVHKVGSTLKRFLGDGGMLAIYYDGHNREAAWRRRRDKAFGWFLREGLSALVAPREVLEGCRSEFEQGQHLVFFLEPEELRFETTPRVPLLVFHPPERPVPSRLYLPSRLADGSLPPPRVVFLPQEARDPNAPHRRLRDVLDCRSLSFDEFLARVSL